MAGRLIEVGSSVAATTMASESALLASPKEIRLSSSGSLFQHQHLQLRNLNFFYRDGSYVQHHTIRAQVAVCAAYMTNGRDFEFPTDFLNIVDKLQVEQLESMEYMHLKRKSTPPVSVKNSKESVPSAPHLKKTLKFVTDIQTTQKPAKIEVLKSKERLGRLKSVRRNSPRDHEHQPWGLSGSAWEEKVQEFIKLKKLKESLAAETKKIPKAVEPNRTSISSSMHPKPQHPRSALIVDLELEEKCQPVVDYLLSLGLCENMLERIVRRRKACLYVKIDKVKERLGYLMNLGIDNEGIAKVLVRHPQVLEYTVEHMMKPRIEYLQSIGVPEARLGRVITVSPSLVECSLGSLKRRVRFLVDEVGVSEEDVSKIVLLSPQLLTQSIDSLRPRISFLSKKVGLSQETVAKMVTKHPQLLHYSIRDGIEPRINFFRNLGLCDRDIALLLSRTSQVLSLSMEKSLRPKCDFLTNELKCGLQTIVSFPAYLSLSLEQRIRPRYEYLKALKKLPAGPFPMCILAVTDEEFCNRWSKTTVEDYHSFRQTLLLSRFVKQFGKKNSLQFEE
ncbi:hypothetical protein KP509_31G038100 [Ceratopteris richardii]|uniref:Uncharacterized protein n=1 Tax=Ceratopteris richardii TaxID=49495 RepID=A0A8T2QYQ0_CERRI|nr:hypothetical protein KP509_31G038100 [Ceratopteris richardii]